MIQHLPNFITILRVICAPAIAFLIWQPQSFIITFTALFLFTIAGISDWLDGYLARKMNIVSSIGRMLDPIADKLLIAACLLGLAAQRGPDGLFLVPALIIILREFMISGLREYLASDKIVVPVSFLAKWKTAMQMVAIGFLIGAPLLGLSVQLDNVGYLIGVPLPDLSAQFDNVGIVLLWLAALFTLQTGLSYFRAAQSHL